MEFLAGSLLELIIQTSTNLPPDVREAMGIAATEKRRTRSRARRWPSLAQHRHGRRAMKAPSARTPACPPSKSRRRSA